MALQCEVIKYVYGEELVFKKAYHQITNISGNKEYIEIQVTSYKDNNKNEIIENKFYGLSPLQEEYSTRWDKQGYEYIKTLLEFKNSVDV